MWTTLKLIEWTTEFFTKHGIPNPRLDTELLLSHVLKKKRIELYLDFEKVVSENDLATFKGLIQRRSKREPLQYIIGTVDFYGVTIKVAPAVLIPRPETELLVEQILKLTNQPSAEFTNSRICEFTILDLCTGSGCIIAALANELPNARFVGTDISVMALDVAGQNVEKWSDRVILLKGNLFEPVNVAEGFSLPLSNGTLKGSATNRQSKLCDYKFDIITSNPPYIPEGEFAMLQPEIRDFEPKEALISGKDGLEIIREIINNAHAFLKPAGYLVMEMGNGQANAVRTLFENDEHYGSVEIVKDYGGIERIIIIQRNNQ